jgi:uncharacterized protein (DUF1697 family)
MGIVVIVVRYRMNTYISFLRGINVSGQKKIKMTELKTVYQCLNYNDVTTYIQSGNVIFKSPESDSANLVMAIEQSIDTTFGYQVTVLLRKKEDLDTIISINPFLKIENVNSDKLHVTFLTAEPEKTIIAALNEVQSGQDVFRVFGREIFLYCPDGYGRTKLTNTFFEIKLGISASTRNWNTVTMLSKIAHEV